MKYQIIAFDVGWHLFGVFSWEYELRHQKNGHGMTQEWREELQISSKQRKKVLHVLLDLLLIHANCISMRVYDIFNTSSQYITHTDTYKYNIFQNTDKCTYPSHKRWPKDSKNSDINKSLWFSHCHFFAPKKMRQACVKGSIQEVHDLILKGADKNAPLDKELKTPFLVGQVTGSGSFWLDKNNLVDWTLPTCQPECFLKTPQGLGFFQGKKTRRGKLYFDSWIWFLERGKILGKWCRKCLLWALVGLDNAFLILVRSNIRWTTKLFSHDLYLLIVWRDTIWLSNEYALLSAYFMKEFWFDSITRSTQQKYCVFFSKAKYGKDWSHLKHFMLDHFSMMNISMLLLSFKSPKKSTMFN